MSDSVRRAFQALVRNFKSNDRQSTTDDNIDSQTNNINQNQTNETNQIASSSGTSSTTESTSKTSNLYSTTENYPHSTQSSSINERSLQPSTSNEQTNSNTSTSDDNNNANIANEEGVSVETSSGQQHSSSSDGNRLSSSVNPIPTSESVHESSNNGTTERNLPSASNTGPSGESRPPYQVTMRLTYNIPVTARRTGGISIRHILPLPPHTTATFRMEDTDRGVDGGGPIGLGGGIIGHGGPALVFEPDPFLTRTRHRLYSILLFRAAMAYFLTVPLILRRIFEIAVLVAAILSFAILIHLHVSFIRSPLTCLDEVKSNWPRDGILRVQIESEHSDLIKEREDFSHSALYLNLSRLEASYNESNFNLSEECLDTYTVMKLQYPLTIEQYRNELKEQHNIPSYSLYSSSSVKYDSHPLLNLNASSLIEEAIDLPPFDDYRLNRYQHPNKKNDDWPYIVEYSLEYGLLRLSEEMRRHYNVPVQTVVLCPEKDACFGDPLARFMLRNFLGYDDVLIGSIKRLAEHENNRGYVRNVATGEHFRFVNVWMTRASYISAGFIMIMFTLFVSMLIRYSHQQVFVFVSEFLRTVEMQQPFSRITFLVASLITVVLALIGMEAIMFEFFADSSIAFHVILMVWAADQFYSMAVRSPISKRYFLRFFYLYQFAFYAYHYRFNGQYSGLALLTTMLFTYHAMIFFFHNYELPLVQTIGRNRANRGNRINPQEDANVRPTTSEQGIQTNQSSQPTRNTTAETSRTDILEVPVSNNSTVVLNESHQSVPNSSNNNDTNSNIFIQSNTNVNPTTETVSANSPDSVNSLFDFEMD